MSGGSRLSPWRPPDERHFRWRRLSLPARRRKLAQLSPISGEVAMPTTFLMLPPQGEKSRQWAQRIAAAHPELEVIAPETMEGAEQAIAMAEAAYGTIPPAL